MPPPTPRTMVRPEKSFMATHPSRGAAVRPPHDGAPARSSAYHRPTLGYPPPRARSAGRVARRARSSPRRAAAAPQERARVRGPGPAVLCAPGRRCAARESRARAARGRARAPGWLGGAGRARLRPHRARRAPPRPAPAPSPARPRRAHRSDWFLRRRRAHVAHLLGPPRTLGGILRPGARDPGPPAPAAARRLGGGGAGGAAVRGAHLPRLGADGAPHAPPDRLRAVPLRAPVRPRPPRSGAIHGGAGAGGTLRLARLAGRLGLAGGGGPPRQQLPRRRDERERRRRRGRSGRGAGSRRPGGAPLGGVARGRRRHPTRARPRVPARHAGAAAGRGGAGGAPRRGAGTLPMVARTARGAARLPGGDPRLVRDRGDREAVTTRPAVDHPPASPAGARPPYFVCRAGACPPPPIGDLKTAADTRTT